MNGIKSITRKPSPETLNQNMMSLIRKVHGMIDKPDIEKAPSVSGSCGRIARKCEGCPDSNRGNRGHDRGMGER